MHFRPEDKKLTARLVLILLRHTSSGSTWSYFINSHASQESSQWLPAVQRHGWLSLVLRGRQKVVRNSPLMMLSPFTHFVRCDAVLRTTSQRLRPPIFLRFPFVWWQNSFCFQFTQSWTSLAARIQYMSFVHSAHLGHIWAEFNILSRVERGVRARARAGNHVHHIRK